MIKSELIKELGAKLDHLPEKDIVTALHLLLDKMSDTLGNGGRIEVRGFGSFCVRYHPPRNAHNPKTGERLMTHGKNTPHFKSGKEMRERIDESAKHCSIVEQDQDQDE